MNYCRGYIFETTTKLQNENEQNKQKKERKKKNIKNRLRAIAVRCC